MITCFLRRNRRSFLGVGIIALLASIACSGGTPDESTQQLKPPGQGQTAEGSSYQLQAGGDIIINGQPAEEISTASIPNLTTEDLIKLFRVKLFNWSQESQNSTAAKPFMEPSLKQELDKIIDNINEKGSNIPANTLERARAEFYISFWTDFKERVFERVNFCRKASFLYKSAIEHYLGYYQAPNDNEISAEDAFIIIEIGHWLVNRDADDIVDNQGNNGYSKASKLYELLPAEKLTTEDLKYNLFVSEGVAFFYQKLFSPAQASFASALEVSKKVDSPQDLRDLRYNLASMNAQQPNYPDAIAEYEASLREPGKEITKTMIYRDLGFTYLLLGRESARAQGIGDYEEPGFYYQKAIDNFKLAETEFANNPNSEEKTSTLTVIDWGLKQATKHKNGQNIDVQSDNLRIEIKRKAFGNVVTHALAEEPVLDIHHDFFYCESGDSRVTTGL